MTNTKKTSVKLKPGDLCKISVNILYYDNLLNTGMITYSEHQEYVKQPSVRKPNTYGIFINCTTTGYLNPKSAYLILVGDQILTVDTEMFDVTKL